jgi:osmotically-inducible protein OsmY
LGTITVPSYAQNATEPSATKQGSDAEVAARVKQALHSDSVLESKHINVEVQHGDVVLKGFVQDSRDLLLATQVATKAAGDRKIVNNISVEQNHPNAP